MSELETVPHGTAILPVRTPRVVVVQGPDSGKTHTASGAIVSIGTAKDNNLILSDETVSRYHLELHHLGNEIALRDLGSTNGTLCGGVRIERAFASAGTKLALGKTVLRIEDGETLEVEAYEQDRFEGVLGRSSAMRVLMASVQRVAGSEASVVITGETGVGKEVIARSIHDASARRDGPFEIVDCGILAPALIASELFGHEKGAFTGADRQRVGAFERASGGTLFLDEIGELPLDLQAALLGALERKSFRRVGGDTRISVDVRVVAATHRDLRKKVNDSSFRSDLYYRLAVVTLRVPALRERAGDIPLLLEHFLRETGSNEDLDQLFSQKVIERLAAHGWPGNVRELRNFVEATVATGQAPTFLEDEQSGAPGGGYFSSGLNALLDRRFKDARAEVLHDFETRYLSRLIERCPNNMSEASRVAEMPRSMLYDMLKRHKLG